MPMLPIDRKVELVRRRISISSIARDLGYSQHHVSQVLYGYRRNERVELAIAAHIGQSREEVFGPVDANTVGAIGAPAPASAVA